MSFKCTVVTPEQQVLDETVSQVIIPAHDGQLGVLTGRAPILVRIGAGPLRIDSPNAKTRNVFIAGGIAQMKDNVLTILTEVATDPASIDAAAAQADLDAALKRPAPNQYAADEKAKAINIARAKLATAAAR